MILILVVVVMFVLLFVFVPVVVMVDVAAMAFPATGVISSIGVVRSDPVRAFIRRPCPVAVMPPVVLALRIPVAIDPQVAGGGLARHHDHARRWWWCANVNVDGDLRMDRRAGNEEP